MNTDIRTEASKRKTLRVSVVTETYPPEINGVAATVAVMVDGLIARRYPVEVIRPAQASDRDATRQAAHPQILVPGIPIPGYGSLRMGTPAPRLLAKHWRSLRPDVVQVATEGPLGWSAIHAARTLGIPVASEFHTNFHAYSAHYGARLLQRPIEMYLRVLHNATATTMVPTRELAQTLAKRGFERLAVVSRGVNTTLFSPAKRSRVLREAWRAPPDQPVVLHVGRLAPEKNVDQVFDTFGAMREHCPQARLVLVGDGPERARLEGTYPGHHFAGMCRGEDLAAHYASADIFLFPSLTETFGNVTLEAMASGLAVVAYDYAGAREHIRHDVNGSVAPFGECDEFRRNAIDLVRDPARTDRLRRAARISAEFVDWTRVLDTLVETLAAVAAKRPHAPAGQAALVTGGAS